MRREPFRGAVVEIFERCDDPDPDFIVPNEVRINGQLLAVTDDHPVVVERVEAAGSDVVRVTLTLLARRVTIGPAPDGTPIKDAAGNPVRIVKDPA